MNQGKRRWSVLASGIIVMLLIGPQYAWSIFRPYLSTMFPTWTATNLSTIFTVSMVVFSVSMFICGKLQMKWGETETRQQSCELTLPELRQTAQQATAWHELTLICSATPAR